MHPWLFFSLCFWFGQVKELDCEGLFSNIESVLETSQKLLKGLENAIENKEGKDQELGNVHEYKTAINYCYITVHKPQS